MKPAPFDVQNCFVSSPYSYCYDKQTGPDPEIRSTFEVSPTISAMTLPLEDVQLDMVTAAAENLSG